MVPLLGSIMTDCVPPEAYATASSFIVCLFNIGAATSYAVVGKVPNYYHSLIHLFSFLSFHLHRRDVIFQGQGKGIPWIRSLSTLFTCKLFPGRGSSGLTILKRSSLDLHGRKHTIFLYLAVRS